MTNYYKVLGVQNFASSNEIKTAYRKLSKKFHPDLNQGDKFFEERFKEIQSAYESLNDSNKRKRLDDYLKQTETKHQYQNYQSKNDNETNRTQKNEQPKEESKNRYSQTPTSGAEKDNKRQQEQTTISQNSNINVYFITGIGLFIFFIVYIIFSNKKEENNSLNSANITPVISSTYESNYIEPSNQEQCETNVDDNIQSITSNNYNRFTIGSTKNEVLNIQGNPTRTTKFDMLDEEIWYYNSSSVTFKSGKVDEYSDNSNILKVKYNNETQDVNESQNFNSYFTMGSTKNEVLIIQGNPTRTTKFDMLDEEIWYYNSSSVTFKSGKVNEYSDNNNILKVKY
jgi:curved DNA-binding protein CbpA